MKRLSISLACSLELSLPPFGLLFTAPPFYKAGTSGYSSVPFNTSHDTIAYVKLLQYH